MNANLASIMPQVLGVWCEQEGHEVQLVCYTGVEDLLQELPADLDLALHRRLHPVGAARLRAEQPLPPAGRGHRAGRAPCPLLSRGRPASTSTTCSASPTGASSPRCCRECAPAPADRARSRGRRRQPLELPTPGGALEVRRGDAGQGADDQDRADDREPGVPLHLQLLHRFDGGLPAAGLRRSCSDDLRSCSPRCKNPIVGWHDPNFGVRFDDYMEAIEAAVPPGRMRHIAESSLSLLSEPHLQRLRQNGFQAILPGIESWYDLGNKSKTRRTGMDKVQQVAEHVNMILRYIPYVQTNFVLGLDGDMGPEPFELTKKFIDLAPGRLPGLLAALGLRPGGADEPGLPARGPGAARSRSTS